MTVLRCAIVGTNFISDWCVNAMRQVDGIEPVAVVSRSELTGQEFASKHSIAGADGSSVSACFTSVNALIQARERGAIDLDAVYIASPNLVHQEQALLAIDAGLHVLCEKIIGVGSREAHKIFDAAARNGVVALEEVRPVHDPRWQIIKDALPRIGTVRRLGFEKSQYSSRYDAFRNGDIKNAFNPELGNSALADIGVYAVQPALWLMGEPRSIHLASTRLHNGFDASGTVTLEFDGAHAECTYSKVSSLVRPSVIEGEDGSILIDSLAEPNCAEVRMRNGDTDTLFDHEREGDWQNLPSVLRDFVAICAGELDAKPWTDTSLRFARVIDRVLES